MSDVELTHEEQVRDAVMRVKVLPKPLRSAVRSYLRRTTAATNSSALLPEQVSPPKVVRALLELVDTVRRLPFEPSVPCRMVITLPDAPAEGTEP